MQQSKGTPWNAGIPFPIGLRRTLPALGLSLGLLLGACQTTGKEDAAPVANTQGAAASARAPEPATAATAPQKPAPTIEEVAVRDVLSQWERAQNQGDFAAYEALFAQRFTGIKRSGPRVRRFDRASWLADRKPMFARSFVVTVNDLHITTTSTMAVVDFEQTYKSASYEDKGPKRIILVKDGESLRITNEEMLTSTLKGAQAEEGKAPDPRDFAFVFEGGNVLLLGELKDLNAVAEHPVYVNHERAYRPMSTKALPKEQRSLIGETFALYDEDSLICEAVVESLFVQIAVEPHFGTVQMWDGEGGVPKASPAERALGLWDLSALGGRFLAARLQPIGSCGRAVWARSTQRAQPELYARRGATHSEEQAILTVVRAHPEYRALQRQYEGVAKKQTPWDLEAARSIEVFERDKRATYVSVSISATLDDGCASDFDPDLWLLLEKRSGEYRVVSAPMEEQVDSTWPRYFDPLEPTAVFDLEGDGVIELASSSDFFRRTNGKFRAVFNLSPGYYSCPC